MRDIQLPRIWLSALAGIFLCGLVAADEHRFTDVERVVAIGDIHGAYEEVLALLEGTGLVDDEGAWTGGEAHLVSLGDTLDRGDHGRQVMDLLRRLQGEAAAAGGAVHVLLGNHEVMNLTGDLRYVSEGDYAQFLPAGDEEEQEDDNASENDTGDASRPPGFAERHRAFAPDGEYGRWLLELPVMVVIADTVFVHGGMSEMLSGMSLEEINRTAGRELRRFAEGRQALIDAGLLGVDDDFDAILDRIEALRDHQDNREIRDIARAMTDALDGLPFDPLGPVWYRGNSMCHPYTQIHVIDEIFDEVNARRVVVGHTPTYNHRITSRMDGRVFRADTGMNHEAYGGEPTALVIEGDSVTAFRPGKGNMDIPAEPPRVWRRPYGMSDEQIEAFLQTAEVVEIRDAGRGVTRPRRLTLEKDGRTMRALFKTIETDPNLQRRRSWGREADHADRFTYEIAAYRIDRLLDLHMVPVTVAQKINGESGSLQYWVEDAFNEVERQEKEIPFTGHCRLEPYYDIMNSFDVLIFNVDRNLGDILYDQDWKLWLVDNSRAFSAQRGVPKIIDRKSFTVPPGFARALDRVTSENLEPLEPYLHRRQIQALIARAQWLQKQ